MYEYVLGNFLIPSMLLILALLSLGKGRRQLNTLVLHAINCSIHVAGLKVPVLPLLSLINVCYFCVMIDKISHLGSLHSAEEPELHGFHEGEYLENLLLCYRNLMLNVCSALLIILLWVTGLAYEDYKPVKDEADKMKKEFYGK